VIARIIPFLLACGVLLAQSPAVKLPPFSKKVLANGATLIVIEKPDVPLVTLRAIFRGGGEAVAPAQAGLAPLTAELLRRGTAALPAGQINEQLDSLGAQLQTSSEPGSTVVTLEYMKRNQDASLALFEQILLKPAFPEAEFTKTRAQAVDRAKSAKDNPGQAINLYWDPFFYPAAHPYHAPLSGDELTLASITRDHVLAYHKANFTGRNLILIASGDLAASTLGPRLEQLASALPAGEAHKPPAAAPVKFDSPRLLLIDKPDATQTYFMIGWPGLARTDRDRTAVQVINTLFGGRFTSMLNDELRVNSGLTYGARSRFEEERLPGSVYISTYTKVESTVQAIDIALGLLTRLRDKGISAEQLLSARNYIKGRFPTEQLETAEDVAAVLGEIELFGLNKGEIDDYFSRLDALNLDQANAAARKWYRNDNLQFLLIGPAAKIQGQVKKYAPKMKVQSISTPGLQTPAFD
jgi:predicted Zn-dependent peptidase